MRELSASHRAALALHYLDGLSIAQIAMAMNVPPGTVKSRLHHARERLRAIIERNERIES
jgi:RNA polymerase sigma-70 factor (ECF subfamily)